jgi:hypothetical protein
MHCWCITSFNIFIHNIIHTRLSAGLTHLLLQGCQQFGAGCWGLKLQTDWSWPLIFGTIRLQQRYHSFRYSLCFPSAAVTNLHRNVLQEGDILCELYVDTCSDVSDLSDNESMDSESDVPTTGSRKQLWSSTGSMTAQFPHPFFLTLWVGTVLNPLGGLAF